MIDGSVMKNITPMRSKKSQAPTRAVPQPVHERLFKMPDLSEWRKKIWNGRVFTAQEIQAMEEFELEGQEG